MTLWGAIDAIIERVAALEDASISTVYFGDRVRYPNPYKAESMSFGMVIPRPALFLDDPALVWVIQRNGKIFGIHRDTLRKVL